jgi:hypothetical protein
MGFAKHSTIPLVTSPLRSAAKVYCADSSPEFMIRWHYTWPSRRCPCRTPLYWGWCLGGFFSMPGGFVGKLTYDVRVAPPHVAEPDMSPSRRRQRAGCKGLGTCSRALDNGGVNPAYPMACIPIRSSHLVKRASIRSWKQCSSARFSNVGSPTFPTSI